MIATNKDWDKGWRPFDPSREALTKRFFEADDGGATWSVVARDRAHAIDLLVENNATWEGYVNGGLVTLTFDEALKLDGEVEIYEMTPEQPAVVVRSWQEVFEVGALIDVLAPRDLLAIVKARHRDKIKQHHPDLGGDPQIAIEINAALAEAEQALGAGT